MQTVIGKLKMVFPLFMLLAITTQLVTAQDDSNTSQ